MKTKKTAPIKLLRLLGSGAFKECYSINHNEVALITRKNQSASWTVDIRQEFKRLEKLRKYKLPVPKARLDVVSHEGQVVEAIILPKFSENFRAWNVTYLTNKISKIKLRRQMNNIKRLIKRHKIHMEDMQFLLRHKDGKIVVSDPGEVTIGRSNYKSCVDDIEEGLTRLG